MNGKQPLVTGAIILTLAGFISRIMGFFYRVFLSHTIGAEGMGIYQLLFPLQALCMAVTMGGIQNAITRLTAIALSLREDAHGKDVCISGVLLTLLLSCPISLLLYVKAPLLGQLLYEDSRTTFLLRLMALSIPFANMHSCITGYFFARKQAAIPSGLQLFEQMIRLGSTYVIYQMVLSFHKTPTAAIAMGGTLISEIAVSVLSFCCLFWCLGNASVPLFPVTDCMEQIRRIGRDALPLSCNRTMIHLLNSLEAILIPRKLVLYGFTSAEALGIYGVFTGMSLPLLLFPSAMVNSLCVLLTPAIAGAKALDQQSEIQNVFGKSVSFSVLLGAFSALGFLILGRPVSTFLFHNKMSGEFVRSLSLICPFLYLSATLSSVLMGLGRNGACLCSNCLAILVRVLFLIFAVPIYGMQGYLWGLLLGELLHAALNIFFCRQVILNVI